MIGEVEATLASDQANNIRFLLGIALVAAGVGFAAVKLWSAKFTSKWTRILCVLLVISGVDLMNWQVYV